MVKNNFVLFIMYSILSVLGYVIHELLFSRDFISIVISLLYIPVLLISFYYIPRYMYYTESWIKNMVSIGLLPILALLAELFQWNIITRFILIPFIPFSYFFTLMAFDGSTVELISYVFFIILFLLLFIRIHFRNISSKKFTQILMALMLLSVPILALGETIADEIQYRRTFYVEIAKLHTDKELPVEEWRKSLDLKEITDYDRKREFKVSNEEEKMQVESLLGIELPNLDFNKYYLYVTAGKRLSEKGNATIEVFDIHDLIVYKVNK